MKKVTVLILFFLLGFIPIVSAEWFASMEAHYIYNYEASYDPELSFSSGSVGLGTMSASRTLASVSYECDFALSTCDESQQKIIIVK
jgi:hypothetical protein